MQHKPAPKVFRERIGNQEYELEERKLDVFEDLILWSDNPRLKAVLPTVDAPSELDLENALKASNGFNDLSRSIHDLGQMEPIYVWKPPEGNKFLVLEGATRVTILRELERARSDRPDQGKFKFAKAKVLPPNFGEEERVILLARIHVRGSGVRSWGRYIEAQFVHEAVVGRPGRAPLMSAQELAKHMLKSVSWVSRLKDAYEFAQKYVEFDDTPTAHKVALGQFSTLEEIAKSPKIGPMVKDYTNSDYDGLRSEVFNMVRNDVFKEYRDARFMREYHEDPEKWATLLAGEKHAAHDLANQLRAGSTSLKARLEALPMQIERALGRDPDALQDDDIDILRNAIRQIEAVRAPGVEQFRLRLKEATGVLEGATLKDIKSVQPSDWDDLKVALEDFELRLNKHKTWQ
jgi:hypothetical protein